MQMTVKSCGNTVALLDFIGADGKKTLRSQRLERRVADGPWLVWTAEGWRSDDGGRSILPVARNFVDENVADGVWQYRTADAELVGAEFKWDYSLWTRIGGEPVGWSFGNYEIPEGEWGEIVTADDMRYTWLWGVDFKASNGCGYKDSQIKFFTDGAVARVERELKLTLKKKRFASLPDQRGLVKERDYDEEEAEHVFRREHSRRTVDVVLSRRPILRISRFGLFSHYSGNFRDELPRVSIDKTRGVATVHMMPAMNWDSAWGLASAIFPYGNQGASREFSWVADYEAGFETAADVPTDLREIVGKIAAVSLLNNIGRGLMSGFSSSSLSMDGMSESFSSTQSATSAYYGADIKEYKDDIERFFKENRSKFGHMSIGFI